MDEEECGERTMSLSGIPVIAMPSIELLVRDRGRGFVELVVTERGCRCSYEMSMSLLCSPAEMCTFGVAGNTGADSVHRARQRALFDIVCQFLVRSVRRDQCGQHRVQECRHVG